MAAFRGSNRTPIVLMSVALLAAAAIILPVALQAQEQPAAAAPARPQSNMQSMGRGFRGMRGQVADKTKNDSTLSMLADFQKESLAAKSAMPPTIAALPEADRPAKIAAYKKEMIKLIRQSLDAEEALLAGDNAKATELLAAMGATQTEGHAEFRGGRRGGGGGGGGAPRGGEGGAPRGQ